MRTDPRNACANNEERLLWALIHDGIAHPLMAVTLFSAWSLAFHDWTSQRAWPRPRLKDFINVLTTTDQRIAASCGDKLRTQQIAFVTRATPIAPGLVRYDVERRP